ncbi:MAG: TolC family protein [Candidatus Binatia bacterium]
MRKTALRSSGVGLALLLPCLTLPSRALACVVGTGTGASCTESALTACLPGGGSFDGTVTFNCGGTATITVTSTKSVSADTTIDGGSLITISGGNSVGVFSVNSGVNLTVQNLTIASGSADFGGGIFSNGGTLTVTNSTFSGNSAGYVGGGIYNDGGTLTVTNSTFSGNSAGYDGLGGGAGISSGRIYIFEGTVTVTNTIIANSTWGGNCAGSVTDGGHNIDDGTTCGFTGSGCTSTSGSSFCNTNPVLDPTGLQNNGGPTQTIALQAGSPAVNAGNESVCAAPPVNNLDQRGYVRPGNGATSCSIGAYEYNSVPVSPTTCTGDCNGSDTVTIGPERPLAELIAHALAQRPEVHESDFRIRAAWNTRSGVLAKALGPTVYGAFEESGIGRSFDVGNRQIYGGFVGWTFTPSSIGDLQVASARLEQTHLQRTQIEQAVKADVVQAHTSMLTAKARVGAAQGGLVAAEESLSLSQDRFKNGAGLELEVIEAQGALTAARTALVDAIVDYDAAQVELLRAIGDVSVPTLAATP